MRFRTTLLIAAAAAAALRSGASAQTFIGQNFTASRSLVDNLRLDYTGAANSELYVELTGGRYSVYRKSDGVRIQTSNLEQFWANAGAPHIGPRAFDPRIVFDPYARRFYAVSADNELQPNSILFAVSRSADPTAGWHGFKIDSDSNDDRWADFPMLGFNKDVVALSANMYGIGTSSQGSLNTFVVLPKNDLLGATPTVSNASRFEEFLNSVTGNSVQPAVDMDNGSLPLPLVSVTLPGATLKRNSVSGTPSAPSIITAGGTMPLNPTSIAAPGADQPGIRAANIFTGDLRSSGSVVKNNGELWAVNCVDSNGSLAGGLAALRWYRINESTNTILENGVITDPSLAFCYPSIAVNDFGDVVIGMSGTAPESASDPDGTFVSAFAVVGKTSGGVTTFGTPFMTKEGVSDYEVLDGSGRNRWGDYSATTNDPADPSIFWTIQKYVYVTDGRATQVTEIIVPQPGEVRWKDPVNGSHSTGANWFGGAAPTNTSHVIFSRATDPAGSGYTVSFGSSQTVDRLSVRQGMVTLDLAGSTLTASNPSDATPGLAVAEYGGAPLLRIVGGSVFADHALVGNDGVINVDGGAALHVAETLRVRDRGVVSFNSGVMSTGLLDVVGGRVNVAATGGTKVLRTTDVQTSNGARIDLTANAMTVDYAAAGGTPLASVKEQIVSAYAAGAWSGPGITTSSGDSSQFGLGYGEASALGTVPVIFGSVDATAVLVRYTRYGDADLNATVNLDDFNRLAANFGSTSAVWTQGDFTYDGRVNLDDFNRLAGNFGLSAGGTDVTPQHWFALAAAVPEPAAAALIGLCGAWASRARRRRG